MTSSRTELLDLVAAYAVDSVDAAERTWVEAALAHDAALRAELDEHRAVLAVLAHAVDPTPATPAPLVWEHIAEQISTSPPPNAAAATLARGRSRLTRVTAALSIAAVALVTVLGISVLRLLAERSNPGVEVAIDELLEDPTAIVATLTANDGSPVEARIVVGRDGIGFLYADNLPTLDASRTYQLWAIVDDRVISAGVLGANPDQAPFQVVGNVQGFALTNEIAGGVPVSEGEPVAVWRANT